MLQYVYISSVLKCQFWVKGKDHLLWPVGNTLSNAGQDTLGLYAVKVHCWLMVILLSTRIPRFFSVNCFPVTQPPAHIGTCFPDIALPFAELHETPHCPFLQPVKVSLNGGKTIWCFKQSPQFWLSANLLKVHSICLPFAQERYVRRIPSYLFTASIIMWLWT